MIDNWEEKEHISFAEEKIEYLGKNCFFLLSITKIVEERNAFCKHIIAFLPLFNNKLLID